MTRLVTLPNCRHNIVINTLFLEPEVPTQKWLLKWPKLTKGIWKRHDTDFDYIFDAGWAFCCRSCCIVKLANPCPNRCH